MEMEMRFISEYENLLEDLDHEAGPFGDARRCPRHPNVKTSSDDGMFDGLCDECEYGYEDEMRAAEEAAWLLTPEGREWAEAKAKAEAEAKAERAAAAARTAWLSLPEGREWLLTPEGREWAENEIPF
jgi:hypothetical protein